MSRLITLECDPKEIRIAVGSTGLTGVTIEHLLTRPLELSNRDELLGNESVIEAVRSMLKEVGVKSGNAVVCIGRSSIELRALTLPTVDANELPDMVRFAAQRQFANVGDSWPIDFITIPSNQPGSSECLAAAINPAIIDRVNKMTESAGLTLTQLVLRPMVSTTMAILKQPALSSSSVVFVDIVHDEADVVVTEKGQAVFLRTFRFSEAGSTEENEQLLTSEIKRTLLAAATQRPGLNVECVRIWGTSEVDHYCKSVSKAFGLPAESIDALAMADCSAEIRKAAGENSGRFAPVLGAMLAPANSARLIDFTNPRKRVEKKKPVAAYALMGALAATVVFGGWFWHWSSHNQLDLEIAELKSKLDAEKDSLKLSAKNVSDWNKVETFLKGDYNWLNELSFLSEHTIKTEKAYFNVTSFTLEPRTNMANVSTKFFSKEQDNVPAVQAALRDKGHVVRSSSILPNPDKSKGYPWVADLSIRLSPIAGVNPLKEFTPDTGPKVTDKASSESKASDAVPAPAPVPAPASTPASVPAPAKSDAPATADAPPATPAPAAETKVTTPESTSNEASKSSSSELPAKSTGDQQ